VRCCLTHLTKPRLTSGVPKHKILKNTPCQSKKDLWSLQIAGVANAHELLKCLFH
jgi:hypothetical protein